ncbi:MAG TPA: TIGR02530 family flagellar biosynthesis protein [Bacillota bacterium]|nr:TIGR02530 family flagellar biosynthesis protein [Bacillota bacterium]
MDDRIHPVQQHHAMPMPVVKKHVDQSRKSFKDLLTDEQKLKISKHAKERMIERHIHLDTHEWNIIAEKMEEAKNKGVTESLVLLKDAALLASIKNNTIVTAINREDVKNRIFTNINGAIVIYD